MWRTGFDLVAVHVSEVVVQVVDPIALDGPIEFFRLGPFSRDGVRRDVQDREVLRLTGH